jgi:hypothetical protein
MENVPAAVEKQVRKVDPIWGVKLCDKLMGWMKARFTPNWFEKCDAWGEMLGNYAVIAAALFGLIFGIVAAIKQDSMSVMLVALAWPPVLAVLQYTAVKLIAAARILIKSSASQLSSESFLSALALLSLVAGVVLFIGLTVVAIRAEDINSFWMALLLLVICEMAVWLCLNPGLLNVNISAGATAGQEAIGVLTFFMKALLRFVPLAYGVGASVGAINIVIDLVRFLRGRLTEAQIFQLDSGHVVLGAVALPLAAYLAFIVYYLSIDVLRAILAVPEKLDALRK